MKKLKLIILSLLFVLVYIPALCQDKSPSAKVYYDDGVAKLTDYLCKESLGLVDSIKHSHFIFYKIVVAKGGGIRSIELLNTQSNYVTSRIEEIIKGGSEKWKNQTTELQTVILPLFLIKDLDGALNSASRHTMGMEEYKQSSSFLEALFITPIIVKIMGPVN